MKKILDKFTLVDYIIIILIICAVIFAFIHITTDDSSDLKKTAFDTTTINKIPDTYFNYYKDGYIVKSTVNGQNATNGEEITMNGTVKWVSSDEGFNVKLLINSNNKDYLVGLYRTVPNADIYIDSISLENDGSKYKNLTEFKIQSENITSLKNLTSGIPNNTQYEITTTISLENIGTGEMQEIENKMMSDNKRLGITGLRTNLENQIKLTQADNQNIIDGNSVLGNINGFTSEITLRVYNCTPEVEKTIENNYNIHNVRHF